MENNTLSALSLQREISQLRNTNFDTALIKHFLPSVFVLCSNAVTSLSKKALRLSQSFIPCCSCRSSNNHCDAFGLLATLKISSTHEKTHIIASWQTSTSIGGVLSTCSRCE